MSESQIKSKPWTSEELQVLYEERASNTPYSHIGSLLSRTKDACRNKFRSTKWDEMNFYDEEYEKTRTSQIFHAEQKLCAKQYDVLETLRMKNDIIADRLAKSLKRLPPTPIQIWKPNRKKTKRHSDEDVGLMLSDLHIGQEFTFRETGNISEYSVDIFKKRLDSLKFAVSDIYELHSQMYDLPNLHIFSLGDVVHGMNHVGAWGAIYTGASICDQVMTGFECLCQAINYWLSIFPTIYFYGLPGNHGRIAPSGQEKDYSNWDNICYELLKVKFENNPRIIFEFSSSWWMMKKIRNHKFLMVHGHDTRSKSHPLMSVIDFEQKMAGLIREMPDYTLAGHFHNASETTSHYGKIIINGAFTGGDMYSLKNTFPGKKPEQKMFGIHDIRGITWRYDIDLDRGKS